MGQDIPRLCAGKPVVSDFLGTATGSLGNRLESACSEARSKPVENIADERRATIDECGVELEEIGAGLDLPPRRLGIADAARPDEFYPALHQNKHSGENPGRKVEQRLAGKPALLVCEG